MSKIQVNEIVNHFDNGAPDCPKGLTVTGFTTFSGSVSVGGTLTYEDVTNVESIGVATFRDDVNIGVGGTVAFFDVSTGLVGIGSADPYARLDVFTTNYPAAKFNSSYTASSKEYTSILLGSPNTNQGFTLGQLYDTVTPSAGYFHITPYGLGEGANFSIKHNGNVGIGLTNPNDTLEVLGSAIIGKSGAASQIRFRRPSEASITGFVGYTDSGNDAKFEFRGDGGSANVKLNANNATGYITFDINSVEKVRINSNGVIGIGETDLSSLGGEYRGMDVGYKGSGISGRTGNPTFTIRSNIYYDGSNWKYGEGNTSAGVLSVGGNQLIFEAAASGTAGATATLTERMRIDSNGRTIFTKSGDPVVIGGVVNSASIYRDATNMGGIHFSTFSILPANEDGNASDNSFDLGATSYRWDDVYATNGTIQTSDQFLKQDVAQLTDAEIAAAKVIRGLVKTYRWIDSVEEKGNEARIHVGVIAQEVEQAFVDQGLDPNRYALFCKNSWYAVDGKAMDDSGETYTEDAPGAVLVERRGVRYPQLLAFVMAAVDAEATAFEARLAALEGA